MGEEERVDSAQRVVPGERSAVWRALVDPDALIVWLPPQDMTGRFERFDARPGGGYRLVLTYRDATSAPGKSSDDSDVAEVRFAELVQNERRVERIDFESDDEAFAGTMTMVWELTDDPAGTRVTVSAYDVPRGIAAADHEIGLASSLANLAEHLADAPPEGKG